MLSVSVLCGSALRRKRGQSNLLTVSLKTRTKAEGGFGVSVSDSTNTLPVIAGVTITTDEQGRFNLNALHQASGTTSAKQPSNWLRLESTRALKNELMDSSNSSDLMSLPIVKNEGRYGGTFAHELLAISYAGWISPSFQLQVNQTFLDYKAGTLYERAQPAFNPAQLSRMDILNLAMEAEKENHQLKEQIAQDQPKVEFHDSVTESDQEIPISQAAKVLGTGEKRLFYFLREYGYLMTMKPDRNIPYQRYIDQGLFKVRLSSYEHPEHGKTTYRKTMVTGKGLVRLGKHLREIEIREKLECQV